MVLRYVLLLVCSAAVVDTAYQGTGKTMLVRALAKEGHARMLQVAPSSIHDKWVGETEKLVKAIFVSPQIADFKSHSDRVVQSLARRLSPCVVFIDEIDALFRTRTGNQFGGVHMEMVSIFAVLSLTHADILY